MKSKQQKKTKQTPRTETATPFFARYLEWQTTEPEARAKTPKTPAPALTLKYPSDRDEIDF